MSVRNLNLMISSENDGTTRNNVPDWLIHMAAEWQDDAGAPHSLAQDRYFLVQLNWLRTTYPAVAKRMMEQMCYRLERVRLGVDDVAVLG